MPAHKYSFVSILFALCIFLLFPVNVFSFFYDDFSDNLIDSTIWQSYNNSGNIFIENGKLKLIRSDYQSNSFPYIFSKTNIFPDSGSFSIYIGYRYLSSGNFGDGITISPEDAPANGIDPGSNISRYISFTIWQDLPNGLSFDKLLCNVDGTKCNEIEFLKPFTHTQDFEPHEIRIDYSDEGEYLIYFDKNPVPEYISGINQRRPKIIWIGNPLSTGSVDFWSSFELDFVKVVPIETRFRNILIPGLGASWDIGAILSGTEGSNWKIPSFVKEYGGIINSFINLKETDSDQDPLVFAYDWRKPLDTLADRLDQFIIDNVPPEEKVNLVGHSMGGLVARTYAQKHGTTRVNKIIMAGSPNMGVVDAYGIWEGALLWNDTWWKKAALEMSTHFGNLRGKTEVQAVRDISPSIKDLMPTDDFLLFDGNSLPWFTLSEKNDYLHDLNQDVSEIDSIATTFYSKDKQTKSSINVATPLPEDILVGKWIDGKPTNDPFETENGDGTVTETSAKGPFTNILQGSGWHGELVTKVDNIKKIFGILGLDDTKALGGQYDSRKDVLVVALRSPGELEVCNLDLTKCNNDLGIFLQDYKLFMFPGYANEDLIVKVIESGFGDYSLHLGDIDKNAKWRVVEGSLVKTDQVDYYRVSGDKPGLFVYKYPPTKQECLNYKWKNYLVLRFKNQGECVSYVARNDRARNRYFWWI